MGIIEIKPTAETAAEVYAAIVRILETEIKLTAETAADVCEARDRILSMKIKLAAESAARFCEALRRILEVGRNLEVRSVTLSAPDPTRMTDDGLTTGSVSAEFHPLVVDVTNEKD